MRPIAKIWPEGNYLHKAFNEELGITDSEWVVKLRTLIDFYSMCKLIFLCSWDTIYNHQVLEKYLCTLEKNKN